jgi:6,7-dimethyl-8-ribityllumazine synthase
MRVTVTRIKVLIVPIIPAKPARHERRNSHKQGFAQKGGPHDATPVSHPVNGRGGNPIADSRWARPGSLRTQTASVQFPPFLTHRIAMDQPGNIIEGNLVAGNARFALVAARFNSFLVDKLVSGALDAIKRHGGKLENTTLAWVPGAFEIPMAAQSMAASGKYDAVICLGAVVRGSTPHFDYVAGEAAKGIAQAGLSTGVPCIFGVVTTDSWA